MHLTIKVTITALKKNRKQYSKCDHTGRRGRERATHCLGDFKIEAEHGVDVDGEDGLRMMRFFRTQTLVYDLSSPLNPDRVRSIKT